ncbi:IQ domain-containing protein F3 isoform X2 [Bos indicus]|uniref:IQ domain-containing protein F3 isoform X2 n=1 Tax=Bos indicus TaxID=9915 RepID=A0ABM4RAX8_BOSIN
MILWVDQTGDHSWDKTHSQGMWFYQRPWCIPSRREMQVFPLYPTSLSLEKATWSLGHSCPCDIMAVSSSTILPASAKTNGAATREGYEHLNHCPKTMGSKCSKPEPEPEPDNDDLEKERKRKENVDKTALMSMKVEKKKREKPPPSKPKTSPSKPKALPEKEGEEQKTIKIQAWWRGTTACSTQSMYHSVLVETEAGRAIGEEAIVCAGELYLGKMGSGQATVLGSHVAHPSLLLPFAPSCPNHPSLLVLA